MQYSNSQTAVKLTVGCHNLFGMSKAQRCVLAGLLAVVSRVSLTAQDQTPVFRSETTLIEFTLVALDRHGNPVTDLRTDEIIVLTDRNRPRDLAVFRYEGGEQSQTAPKLPAGMFTNAPELTPGPPRSVTAILLDTLNTQPRHQTWIKAQAMRYLHQLLPNTRVAVYLLGPSLTVVHDFTDDPDSLRGLVEQTQVRLQPTAGQIDDMAREMETLIQRLEDYNPGSPETVGRLLQVERRAQESANEQRTQRTLGSLEALGDHLAGIPGRKSIVWFGSGVTMLSVTGSLEFATPGGIRSQEDLVRRTSRRLAQQGVTLYVFDARGMQVQADMSVERGRADPLSRGQIDPWERLKANARVSADTVPAMVQLAEITGGRYYWNTNDVGRAVAEIIADSRGTYSLGFYADNEPDGKWHRLDVRVSRKGIKLQHRDGYVLAATQDAPLEWTDEQWRAAVYNPLGSTAVRLDARLHVDAGDVKTVGMILQIVAGDLRFREMDGRPSAAVDMAIVGKLPDGRFQMQRDLREIPAPTGEASQVGVVQVRHSWELTPGASTVRLIVLDRLTGRYGTLDVPVRDIP